MIVSYPVAIVAMCAAVATARAETSAVCARLRDEASAEAALLYAPRVELQGAHIPTVVALTDPSSTAAAGFQARASLVLSPVDMLRGRALERIASADCRQTTAGTELERVLEAGPRYGELAATRAEIAYLESHLGEIDTLVREAAARLEHQRATALEVDELHHERAVLRIRLADLHFALAALEELDRDLPRHSLAELVESYRRATLEVGDRRADARALTAWQLDIRGGVAGGDGADWFAVVELGYSLGARWQAAADRRAHADRADELAHDDRELPARIAQLERVLHQSITSLDTELGMLDDEIAIVRAERNRLDELTGDGAAAAQKLRARYTIEILQLEGRRARAATLAAARRAFLGDTP